jgi:hypothetical protein
MTDETKPSDPKPAAEDTTSAARKITRRRFTKAGAVAPIIMTLAPRAVFGQGPCLGVGSVMASVDPAAASVSQAAKDAIEACEECIAKYQADYLEACDKTASYDDALAACEKVNPAPVCPDAGTISETGSDILAPISEK